ncbi:MAG: hypothetical protein AAF799_15555 [Myxococcota bacterium]
MRRLKFIAGSVCLGLAGCPDDEPSATGTPMASGFAEDADAGPATGNDDADATAGTAADDSQQSAGTAFSGELSGLLTVTYTPAHPLFDQDQVGLAGGYRTSEVGWEGAEDLYSPVAYQLGLPTPPDEPDTLLPAEALPVYDWGSDSDWVLAGNGMKLRQGEGGPELQACLLPAGDYPLYRSSTAMGVPEDCSPPAENWLPGTAYDVVLYGGETFADNVLLERVTTPAALTVTAPDIAMFNLGVPVDADLTVSWEAGDDPEARIIIRVIDAETNVITVHAADDGEYVIPAAELGALSLGPADLVIARERTDGVQFTNGGLTVLGRHERWGFIDLF